MVVELLLEGTVSFEGTQSFAYGDIIVKTASRKGRTTISLQREHQNGKNMATGVRSSSLSSPVLDLRRR